MVGLWLDVFTAKWEENLLQSGYSDFSLIKKEEAGVGMGSSFSGTTEVLKPFLFPVTFIVIGTKCFLASLDGAAMRAGVQTGDRIIKVRAYHLSEKLIL